MRHTSVQNYRAVEASGLLSERRLETLKIITDHGPMTGNEASKIAGKPGLWKRFSELEAWGLVRIVGQRKCKVTGRTALVWDVTDNPPVKPEKREESKCVACPKCHGKGRVRIEDVTNLVHRSSAQLDMFGGRI